MIFKYALNQVGGRPERAGWLAWDNISEEWDGLKKAEYTCLWDLDAPWSDVHIDRKKLPGKIRQRIKRIIVRLAQEPYPSNSVSLNLADATELEDWEVKRIRIDEWRIIYAVSETWCEISILTIQKRPPYDYDNIDELISYL